MTCKYSIFATDMKLKNIIIIALGAALMLCSCEKSLQKRDKIQKVFIMYSCGYNNLSRELLADIAEVVETSPLSMYNDYCRILVFSHRADGSYTKAVNPVLMEVYTDMNGNPVMDTIATYPGRTGSDAGLLNEVLLKIKDGYPAEEYGFLFSSHGTGWLPFDYYANPTKTLGSDTSYEGGSLHSGYEMDVTDFAAAFPMKMEYMLLDACFASGIETAYELKDVTDYFVASPAEILSDGLVYTDIVRRVMGQQEADVYGICEDYMKHYENQYAAITLVDCRKLDRLAEVCSVLFEKYRYEMDSVDEQKIQAYFRRERRPSNEKHWFYDLEDIFIQCEATPSDLDLLHSALEECVLFADATERLFGYTGNQHVCGLSMYLPQMGNEYLNDYYRTYKWNKDTGLVE